VNRPEPPSDMPAADGHDDLFARLDIRAAPRGVVRLSRPVIGGLAGLGALALAGALYWGMQRRETSEAPQQELMVAEQKTRAEGFDHLPKDYASLPREIPKLGPPLPGDLGRPMLNAGVLPSATIGTPTPVDPETRRQNQELDAARVSRLFAPTTVRQTTTMENAAPQPAGETRIDGAQTLPFANDETFAQSGQDRKRAFANAQGDKRMISADRLKTPPSPFILQAGAIIPGALLTGIRSDLPGEITAQVTEHVYDSPTGRALLIPQGSRLIGAYDSQIAFGQSRVLLVWTRLILPNGNSILLDRQKGADVAGYSGLEDDVDNHWGALFRAAAVSTLLSVGSQIAVGNSDNQLQQAIAQGAALGFNQIGRQIIGRNLNIQPTLTIRPGFPVRVVVNRDLILEPYQTPGDRP
jgi:type IV secretory pathway VirB10-like protein